RGFGPQVGPRLVHVLGAGDRVPAVHVRHALQHEAHALLDPVLRTQGGGRLHGRLPVLARGVRQSTCPSHSTRNASAATAVGSSAPASRPPAPTDSSSRPRRSNAMPAGFGPWAITVRPPAAAAAATSMCCPS